MNVGENRFPVTFIRNEDGIRMKSKKKGGGREEKKRREKDSCIALTKRFY